MAYDEGRQITERSFQAISKTLARRCEEAVFADEAIPSTGERHYWDHFQNDPRMAYDEGRQITERSFQAIATTLARRCEEALFADEAIPSTGERHYWDHFQNDPRMAYDWGSNHANHSISKIKVPDASLPVFSSRFGLST